MKTLTLQFDPERTAYVATLAGSIVATFATLRDAAAIATLSTNNRKTGQMIQIWFVLRDTKPTEVVKTGLDAATICNGCPFASGQGCYVNVGQAPLAVWRAYRAGRYPMLYPRDYATVFGGRAVRFGAYGNPSLLPLSIVKAIASVAKGWTGYFHDWKTNPLAAEYARYFMASTETAASLAQAQCQGFRVFHVSPIQPANTRECLSESHGLQCEKCLLCSGLAKAAQRSIWINPHGSKTAKATAVAMQTA